MNGPDLLTPVGEWVAARLPHIDFKRNPWGRQGELVFRVYGLKPLYRYCILDYTKTRLYTGKPPYSRLRLFGWAVFERNKQFSGSGRV